MSKYGKCLIIETNSDNPPRYFELQPGLCLIGRSLDSHIRLQNPKVCEKECTIIVEDSGQAYVISNHIFSIVKVNGLTLSKNKKQILKNGDQITFASVQIVYQRDRIAEEVLSTPNMKTATKLKMFPFKTPKRRKSMTTPGSTKKTGIPSFKMVGKIVPKRRSSSLSSSTIPVAYKSDKIDPSNTEWKDQSLEEIQFPTATNYDGIAEVNDQSSNKNANSDINSPAHQDNSPVQPSLLVQRSPTLDDNQIDENFSTPVTATKADAYTRKSFRPSRQSRFSTTTQLENQTLSAINVNLDQKNIFEESLPPYFAGTSDHESISTDSTLTNNSTPNVHSKLSNSRLLDSSMKKLINFQEEPEENETNQSNLEALTCTIQSSSSVENELVSVLSSSLALSTDTSSFIYQEGENSIQVESGTKHANLINLESLEISGIGNLANSITANTTDLDNPANLEYSEPSEICPAAKDGDYVQPHYSDISEVTDVENSTVVEDISRQQDVKSAKKIGDSTTCELDLESSVLSESDDLEEDENASNPLVLATDDELTTNISPSKASQFDLVVAKMPIRKSRRVSAAPFLSSISETDSVRVQRKTRAASYSEIPQSLINHQKDITDATEDGNVSHLADKNVLRNQTIEEELEEMINENINTETSLLEDEVIYNIEDVPEVSVHEEILYNIHEERKEKSGSFSKHLSNASEDAQSHIFEDEIEFQIFPNDSPHEICLNDKNANDFDTNFSKEGDKQNISALSTIVREDDKHVTQKCDEVMKVVDDEALVSCENDKVDELSELSKNLSTLEDNLDLQHENSNLTFRESLLEDENVEFVFDELSADSQHNDHCEADLEHQTITDTNQIGNSTIRTKRFSSTPKKESILFFDDKDDDANKCTFTTSSTLNDMENLINETEYVAEIYKTTNEFASNDNNEKSKEQQEIDNEHIVSNDVSTDSTSYQTAISRDISTATHNVPNCFDELEKMDNLLLMSEGEDDFSVTSDTLPAITISSCEETNECVDLVTSASSASFNDEDVTESPLQVTSMRRNTQSLRVYQNNKKSPRNELTNFVGVKKLLKTPKVAASPKLDGVKSLMATPRSRKDSENNKDIKRLTTTPREKRSSKYSLSNLKGIKKPLKTSGKQKSPNNDLSDFSGVKKMLATPRVRKSPKNELSDLEGVKKMLATPRVRKSPKNELSDLEGVKQLLNTPQKSPENDLRDVKGVKNLLKTPHHPKSPENDLRDVIGVRKLLATPRVKRGPKNDLSDVRGVKKLLETPREQKSPENDLRDVKGVKNLLKTPYQPKSPKNDLRDIVGIKKMLATPRLRRGPKNDLSDVRGVKKLLETPRVQKSPENDLTDVAGVKNILATPRLRRAPKNELSNLKGVKKLMKTPRVQKSPNNDLTNVSGVKKLLKEVKTPKNELSDLRGVRKLMQHAKNSGRFKNDLSDVKGVKKLMSTPKPAAKSPKNSLENVSGVGELFRSPKRPQKSPRNSLSEVSGIKKMFADLESSKNKDLNVSGVEEILDDSSTSLFDSLVEKKPIRTYSRKSSPIKPKKDKSVVLDDSLHIQSPAVSTDVTTWINNQQFNKDVNIGDISEATILNDDSIVSKHSKLAANKSTSSSLDKTENKIAGAISSTPYAEQPVKMRGILKEQDLNLHTVAAKKVMFASVLENSIRKSPRTPRKNIRLSDDFVYDTKKSRVPSPSKEKEVKTKETKTQRKRKIDHIEQENTDNEKSVKLTKKTKQIETAEVVLTDEKDVEKDDNKKADEKSKKGSTNIKNNETDKEVKAKETKTFRKRKIDNIDEEKIPKKSKKKNVREEEQKVAEVQEEVFKTTRHSKRNAKKDNEIELNVTESGRNLRKRDNVDKAVNVSHDKKQKTESANEKSEKSIKKQTAIDENESDESEIETPVIKKDTKSKKVESEVMRKTRSKNSKDEVVDDAKNDSVDAKKGKKKSRKMSPLKIDQNHNDSNASIQTTRKTRGKAGTKEDDKETNTSVNTSVKRNLRKATKSDDEKDRDNTKTRTRTNKNAKNVSVQEDEEVMLEEQPKTNKTKKPKKEKVDTSTEVDHEEQSKKIVKSRKAKKEEPIKNQNDVSLSATTRRTRSKAGTKEESALDASKKDEPRKAATRVNKTNRSDDNTTSDENLSLQTRTTRSRKPSPSPVIDKRAKTRAMKNDLSVTEDSVKTTRKRFVQEIKDTSELATKRLKNDLDEKPKLMRNTRAHKNTLEVEDAVETKKERGRKQRKDGNNSSQAIIKEVSIVLSDIEHSGKKTAKTSTPQVVTRRKLTRNRK